MKLLKKTNQYFIGVSLLIFCLGGILFYFLFQVIIDDDINSKLLERKDYTIKQLERSDSLTQFQHFSANMLAIQRIPNITSEKDILNDTSIFDKVESKIIEYRQLTFQRRIHNKPYVIQVRRAIVAHESLVEGVVFLEVLLFAAFVLTLTLINNEISKKIWQPFYFALDKITHYKVDLAQNMKLPNTPIDEFNELSQAIEKMSTKIHNEFNIQKEFSENASHEIQTPLAIVRNKLEILMQSELSKEQIELINSATTAITRLSKLNEALIILSKIENRQFHYTTEISIADIIDKIVGDLEELIKLKSISVVKDYRNSLNAKMNPYLCEILLENLIINSVKHNIPAGKINIVIESTRLKISNSGESHKINTDQLFHRFVKSNAQSQSLGLGLSIVKAVCDTYGFDINYNIENGEHVITLNF